MLSISPNGDKGESNVDNECRQNPVCGEPLANFENAFDRLKWILAQAIPHTYKMLFVCLLSHADIYTGECYPSIKTLAGEGGLSRATVYSGLKWLKAHGYLTMEHRFNTKGIQTSSRYTLRIPEGVQEVDPPRPGDRPGGVQQVDPEYIKKYLRQCIRRMRHCQIL